MKDSYKLKGVKFIIAVSIVLGLFGCSTSGIVNQAHTKENILIKDVPYVHQRWRLD